MEPSRVKLTEGPALNSNVTDGEFALNEVFKVVPFVARYHETVPQIVDVRSLSSSIITKRLSKLEPQLPNPSKHLKTAYGPTPNGTSPMCTRIEIEESEGKLEPEMELDTTSSVAAISLARNIFEDNDNNCDDNMTADDILQIGDTSDLVGKLTPETMLVTLDQDITLPIPESRSPRPILAGLKYSTLTSNQSRADNRALDRLKQRVAFQVQKAANGSIHAMCPMCEQVFPAENLQDYRSHLGDHNIIINKGRTNARSKIISQQNANCRVAEAQRQQHRVVQRTAPQLELTHEEWFKCTTCDELLKKTRIPLHRANCCPEQPADLALAFVPVKIANNPTNTVLLRCGLCEKSCKSISGLRQHFAYRHSDIGSKILFKPALRCGSCLAKFEDTIQLTLHLASCIRRMASFKTILELAQGLLYCEICLTTHDSVTKSQDCYSANQLFRCVICLHVTLSYRDFFNHVKSCHSSSPAKLSCPFCQVCGISTRDCFIHIIEVHYNPALALYKRGGRSAIDLCASNRLTAACARTTNVETTPLVRLNLVPRSDPGDTTANPVVQPTVLAKVAARTPIRFNLVTKPTLATAKASVNLFVRPPGLSYFALRPPIRCKLVPKPTPAHATAQAHQIVRPVLPNLAKRFLLTNPSEAARSQYGAVRSMNHQAAILVFLNQHQQEQRELQ